MLFHLFSAAGMAGLFLYMFFRVQMPETRKMMWIPAGCSVIEVLTAGTLGGAAFSWVTVALCALRLTIVGLCVAAVRYDAALVRARRRRREKLARRLHAALNPLHEVETPAAAPSAAQIA